MAVAPTSWTQGDGSGLRVVWRGPECPSPKETDPKLSPSSNASLAMSLTTSENAIARYCMQLFRK